MNMPNNSYSSPLEQKVNAGHSLKTKILSGACALSIIASGALAYGCASDNPPVITNYDPVQEQAYVGDTINFGARVTDDRGIENVLGVVQNENGQRIGEVPLAESNGSYLGTYELPEGTFDLYLEARDNGNNITTQHIGNIEVIKDNPPVITYGGILPESVYVGNNVEITGIKATDDVKLEDLVVYVMTPKDEKITLEETNGSYGYKPGEEGIHTVFAEATDSRGQTQNMELGEILCKIDPPPVIDNFFIPDQVYSNAGFAMTVHATDNIEVKKVYITFGNLESIVLENVREGKWQAHTTLKPGSYDYILTVVDNLGQETTIEGTITSIMSGGVPPAPPPTPTPPPPPPPPPF
jgi:hypothetical protein